MGTEPLAGKRIQIVSVGALGPQLGGDRLAQLITSIQDAGGEVSLLLSEHARGHPWLSRLGPDGDVVFVRSDPVRTRAELAIEYPRRYRRAVRARTRVPDLVYALSGQLLDIGVARRLAGRHRARLAAVVDNFVPPPWKRPGPLMTKTLASLAFSATWPLYRSSDLLFPVTRALRDGLLEKGIPGSRVVLSGNGVPRPPSSLAEDPAYDIVYMGRLHPAKGIHDLVAALDLVRLEIPDVQCLMIGSGDPKSEAALVADVKKRGLEASVQYAGYLMDGEKFRALARGRVYAFPSHDESFAVTVGEALRVGLPVVAYDLPAFKEVYPGMVQTAGRGNVAHFARSLQDAVKAERARPGRRADPLGAPYDWSTILDREVHAMATVLQGAAS